LKNVSSAKLQEEEWTRSKENCRTRRESNL
jgi:hypothetical protein